MIPLLYLLFFYAFFTLLALLFLFFNVYHMAKFGLQSGKTYFFITLYVSVFLGALLLSASAMVQIDWSQTISAKELFITLFNPGNHLVLPL